MQKEIEWWFATGCDYRKGEALYRSYGKSDVLKTVFKIESGFNLQKLIAELDKMRIAAADHHVIHPKTPEKEASPAVPPPPEKNQFPELLKVKEVRERAFGELRSLHPYLSVLPEGKELLQLAKNILGARKVNTAAWMQYNDLLENGPATKPVEPAPVMVPMELIDSAENLRKSISKAEKRIRNQNPVNPKSIELLRVNKAKLAEMRRQIAAFKGGAQ